MNVKQLLGTGATFLFFLAQPCASEAQTAEEYFSQAFKYVQSKEEEKARALYKEGLKIDPSNGLGHYYLAQLYDPASEEAYVHFRRASELIPTTPQGMDALASRRVIAEKLFGDYEKDFSSMTDIFYNHILVFTSDTHKFCVKMVSYKLPYDPETFHFGKDAFIELVMWISNKKSRNMEKITQRYASDRFYKDPWGIIEMTATEPVSKLGKYMPQVTINYSQTWDVKLNYKSDNLEKSRKSGELSYASTNEATVKDCWL